MDFHVSSEMVRASSRVRTELTSVGLFLGVDTLVTLQMARPDRLVGAARILAAVVVYFL